MKKTLSIIILNYKNYTDTINCIESILSHTRHVSYRIIVVDNASSNQSLEKIDLYFSKRIITSYWNENNGIDSALILVRNKTNSGYAAGNNVGLKIAWYLGSDYLLVLNNDIIIISDAISQLISEIDKLDNALCIGPVLIKQDNSFDFNCAKRRPKLSDFFVLSYFGRWLKTAKWHNAYYYLKEYPNITETTPVDIVSGSCMLFKSEVFKKIDFFDEKTFLYFEEAILEEKGRRERLKMYLLPSVQVIHLGAQSTSNNSSSSHFTMQCEYDSAVYYLTKWRGISNFQAKLVCLPMLIFIKLYKIKSLLKDSIV